MKRKSTKVALLTSVICVVLCGALVLGGTLAWFNDTATSENNIIKSGTLDVKMTWSNEIDGTYEDASAGKIFNYQLWEPGYTDVKYINIKNVGDLAFKYSLTLNSNEVANEHGVKLSDVIDVYIGTGEVTSREYLTSANMVCVGTLADILENSSSIASNVMLPKNDKTITLVLKMQESAGNEYQNLSVGDGIAVQLLAEQYTYEKDSFGDDYDGKTHLPVAAVYRAPEYIDTTLEWNPQSPAQGYTLDTAYVFKTTEEFSEAQKNEHAKWHADFVISFDRDVTAADGIGIAGNYADFDWIGFDLTEDLIKEVANDNSTLSANTPVRLLDTAGISMNYEGLCEFVKEFYCGAWANSIATDLTINVELRLYEVETPSESNNNSWNKEVGPDNYEKIGAYSYTFTAEVPADLPNAKVIEAPEYVGKNDLNWNSSWGTVPANAPYALETAYTFSTEETYDEALAGNYGDWIADFAISFDKDVTAANGIGIAGNYADYGWAGFLADEEMIKALEESGLAENGAIKAGTVIELLKSVDGKLTYAELCNTVKKFSCGAWADNANGTTITVELRLTNPNAPYNHYVVEQVTYTFE